MKRIAIGVLLAIVVVAIGHFYGPTIYRVSTDRPTLEAYLAEAGLWAPLVFVVLMATQVVVAPLPGLVVGLVGGYVFGAARGFLLNLAGFTLGAMIAFSLARYFGKPLVRCRLLLSRPHTHTCATFRCTGAYLSHARLVGI